MGLLQTLKGTSQFETQFIGWEWQDFTAYGGPAKMPGRCRRRIGGKHKNYVRSKQEAS